MLVHGSWTDHLSWQLVTPMLAERHRVLVYDRRGHSRSERPTTQGARRQDEDDLAALVEALDLAPVHLVGNSYGASIALGLAARRADLVHSVIAHEPPLLGIARPGTALAATADQVHATLDEVAAMLRAGDLEGGTRHFIEAVALGPGTWQMLPDDSRRTFVANAATFLDAIGDPHWAATPERQRRPGPAHRRRRQPDLAAPCRRRTRRQHLPPRRPPHVPRRRPHPPHHPPQRARRVDHHVRRRCLGDPSSGTMTAKMLDDVGLWVDQRGDGPDVLLIAGLGNTTEAWAAQLAGIPGCEHH